MTSAATGDDRPDDPENAPRIRSRSFGVMHLAAGDAAGHQALVEESTALLREELGRAGLELEVFSIPGPHLQDLETEQPLEILQLALVEKLERRLSFLLVIVDVDLASRVQSYTFALPSQLLNIGIISSARVRPEFWGRAGDREQAASRLGTLVLHTAGHLFGLRHQPGEHPMREIAEPADLDAQSGYTPRQREEIRQRLPTETRDHMWPRRDYTQTLRYLFLNAVPALKSALRARPWALGRHLSTLITVALSLIIVLFFSAEVWDLAGAMQPAHTVVFAVVSVSVATWVLYRAFALRTVVVRRDMTAETILVTTMAAILALLMTVVLLLVFFSVLMYLAAQLVFPQELMQSWTTVRGADTLAGQIQLSVFLGAMGVLAGSLGGAAQDREVIRHILFLDEET